MQKVDLTLEFPRVLRGFEDTINACFKAVVQKELGDYPNFSLESIDIVPILEFDYLGVRTPWGSSVHLEASQLNLPIWDLLLGEARKVEEVTWKLGNPPSVLVITLNLKGPQEVWEEA
jgi:hypothetical protein